MEKINWYPGHMKKTRELIETSLPLVDAVMEIFDARIPFSGRNPVLADLSAEKLRIAVLTKIDLADPAETKRWAESLTGDFFAAIPINARTGDGLAALTAALKKADEARSEKARAKAKLRAMIVGVPNSGKSSLINKLTGRRSAAVGNRPGVTKGKQWLTLEGGIQLLDTPGILLPNIVDQETALKLAFCGSVKDEILDISELALEFIRFMLSAYPKALSDGYGIELPAAEGGAGGLSREGETARQVCTGGGERQVSTEDALRVMERIAEARGFLMRGGRIDYERTARTALNEFRSGKLGRFTLEKAGFAGTDSEPSPAGERDSV